VNEFKIYRKNMSDDTSFSENVPKTTASAWTVEERREVDEIVDLVAKIYPPEKIPLSVYLFGSFAYGNPDESSDYDICIVTVEKLSYAVSSKSAKVLFEYETSARRKRSLDIIVTSYETLERKDSGTCFGDIAEKGVLLYRSELSADSKRWKRICEL